MPREAVFIGSYSKVQQIPRDNHPQIAFAGRSNVGKSSLLNKLVNRKRLARTSKTPGRTRLLNFFLVDERFYFVDLPGYGYAKASIAAIKEWGRLVNSYLETASQLKAMLLLLDSRREPNEDDLMLLDWATARNIELAVVLTKADKISKSKLTQKTRDLNRILKAEVIPFSVMSGLGRKELWHWIDNYVN
jgi:GTP-binding protein